MAQTPDPVELFAQMEALKAELNVVSKRLSAERDRKVRLEEAVLLACRASFASLPRLDIPKPAPDRRRRKQPEVANPHNADWHIGFDPIDTTRTRVEAYRNKIIEIVEIARADHPVQDAHLPFLGDQCHGEQIYPSSPYEQDSSLIDQAITDGAALACDYIIGLLPTFRHIHIPWISGNHGWLGPRKGGVYDPDSNLDRAMGFVVKGRLDAAGLADRVTFDIPRPKRRQFGSLTVDRIGNWSVLLMHGKQLQGGSSYGGLPYYGFNKKGLSFGHLGDHGTLPQFKDIAVGHYHVVFSIPVMAHQLRGCGTLQSETTFEVETLAAFSRPAQLLTFVHPEAGEVTAEYTVRLG